MKNAQFNDSTIEQTASEWVVRSSEPLSPEAAVELKAWLAADPRHAEAYARLARTWTVFDRAAQKGATGDIAMRVAQRARRRHRHRVRLSLATAAVLLLGVFLFWERRPGPSLGPAEVQPELIAESVRRLPDGSIVELKPGAGIDVRYEADQRRVELTKGEALFRVAKDPARPFRVRAGSVEVVAVGTAFSVQLAARAVEVVVTEGRVQLAHDHAAATPVSEPVTFVDAGNLVVVDTAEAVNAPPVVRPISGQEIEQRLAWRESLFGFDGMRLADAVALMNRVNRVQISLADTSIGQLRVSGTFRADNWEGFVRIVESTFDLQAERRGEDQIVIHRR